MKIFGYTVIANSDLYTGRKGYGDMLELYVHYAGADAGFQEMGSNYYAHAKVLAKPTN